MKSFSGIKGQLFFLFWPSFPSVSWFKKTYKCVVQIWSISRALKTLLYTCSSLFMWEMTCQPLYIDIARIPFIKIEINMIFIITNRRKRMKIIYPFMLNFLSLSCLQVTYLHNCLIFCFVYQNIMVS